MIKNFKEFIIEKLEGTFNPKTILNHIQERPDIFDGSKFFQKEIKLFFATVKENPDKVKLFLTDISSFGGILNAKFDGKEFQLSKKKLKPKELDFIFGWKESKEKQKSQPTNFTREVDHNDVSRLKPVSIDGKDIVKLKNGQIWVFKGISAYKVDNENRVNGWERV